MLRELRVGNFYADETSHVAEVFTMVVHNVAPPSDFESEQAYLDYLEFELFPLTGSGRTEGSSFYTVRSIDDVEPRIEMEFG